MADTRPIVSTPKDREKWRQPDDPGPKKFGDINVSQDSRLSKIIAWVAGLASIIVSGCALAIASKFWLINDSQIRIEEKIDAANQVQNIQFSQMDRRMIAVEGRVGAIEQRQIEAQNQRARP